eukprot:SAG11_NODE_33884_length_275_cov_0.494318_1_plen_64_part_10
MEEEGGWVAPATSVSTPRTALLPPPPEAAVEVAEEVAVLAKQEDEAGRAGAGVPAWKKQRQQQR